MNNELKRVNISSDTSHSLTPSGWGLELFERLSYIYIYMYFALLNIHRWFNITNIIPRSPDDGSLEPKCYSVNFASQ